MLKNAPAGSYEKRAGFYNSYFSVLDDFYSFVTQPNILRQERFFWPCCAAEVCLCTSGGL